ncbi:MAG: hypothetical protein NVS4B8_30490 [Herpetosiphon sp.]
MARDKWSALVDEAQHFLSGRQAGVLERYRLQHGKRYDWDLDVGEMTFSVSGHTQVVAQFEVVGSISMSEGTWLWSWANEVIPQTARRQMHKVRRFGQAKGFARLTEPFWPATERDGQDMLAVSALVLDAAGFWRDYTPDLALFFVLTQVTPVVSAP